MGLEDDCRFEVGNPCLVLDDFAATEVCFDVDHQCRRHQGELQLRQSVNLTDPWDRLGSDPRGGAGPGEQQIDLDPLGTNILEQDVPTHL